MRPKENIEIRMAEQMELFCESTMRGYHAYTNERKVSIGEIMFCEIEDSNEYDENAVAIKTKDGEIVGHVPEELSSLFHNFLKIMVTLRLNALAAGLTRVLERG